MPYALSTERCLGDLARVDEVAFAERLRVGVEEPVVVRGLAEGAAAMDWTHASLLAHLGVAVLPRDGVGRALDEELARDVRFPAFLTRITQKNVWLFADGSRSELHCDLPHNLNTVLRGEKEWLLFPREERGDLYAGSTLSALGPCNSQVDLDAIDLRRFPRIARARYWRATVVAGESVYVPPGVWHFVRSRGESIAVNVWFHGARSRLSRGLERPLAVNVRAVADGLMSLLATARRRARASPVG